MSSIEKYVSQADQAANPSTLGPQNGEYRSTKVGLPAREDDVFRSALVIREPEIGAFDPNTVEHHPLDGLLGATRSYTPRHSDDPEDWHVRGKDPTLMRWVTASRPDGKELVDVRARAEGGVGGTLRVPEQRRQFVELGSLRAVGDAAVSSSISLQYAPELPPSPYVMVEIPVAPIEGVRITHSGNPRTAVWVQPPR